MGTVEDHSCLIHHQLSVPYLVLATTLLLLGGRGKIGGHYCREIAGGGEVFLFISLDLLEDVVTTRFSLYLFENEVVGRGDLVMLVILDVDYGLVVEVWVVIKR